MSDSIDLPAAAATAFDVDARSAARGVSRPDGTVAWSCHQVAGPIDITWCPDGHPAGTVLAAKAGIAAAHVVGEYANDPISTIHGEMYLNDPDLGGVLTASRGLIGRTWPLPPGGVATAICAMLSRLDDVSFSDPSLTGTPITAAASESVLWGLDEVSDTLRSRCPSRTGVLVAAVQQSITVALSESATILDGADLEPQVVHGGLAFHAISWTGHCRISDWWTLHRDHAVADIAAATWGCSMRTVTDPATPNSPTCRFDVTAGQEFLTACAAIRSFSPAEAALVPWLTQLHAAHYAARLTVRACTQGTSDRDLRWAVSCLSAVNSLEPSRMPAALND